MSKDMVISTFLTLCCFAANSQQPVYEYPHPSKNKLIKGWFYGSFGWHRIYYTHSTIYFRNNNELNYDFKLIRAKARDDNDLNIGKGIDAPQWSLRFGYLFNHQKGWGIEWSYDHAKYVLRQGQQVRLKGNINGQYFDRDTLIHPDFIEYEHTDGANYYMLNLVKRILLHSNKKGRQLDILNKAGAGLVIPRTDSRILGWHYNEHYHVSGWLAGMESTLRYELLKNFFAELSAKLVYARYSDVLLSGGGRANQNWWSFQYLFTAGYQLPVASKIR
jgi:hypothetical protein